MFIGGNRKPATRCIAPPTGSECVYSKCVCPRILLMGKLSTHVKTPLCCNYVALTGRVSPNRVELGWDVAVRIRVVMSFQSLVVSISDVCMCARVDEMNSCLYMDCIHLCMCVCVSVHASDLCAHVRVWMHWFVCGYVCPCSVFLCACVCI